LTILTVQGTKHGLGHRQNSHHKRLISLKIAVIKNILKANERIPDEKRKLFQSEGVTVINLMNSPCSGKTSLVERTIEAVDDQVRITVIEGDIESTNDAERISQTGVQAVQINTSGACHLDRNMVRDALPSLNLSALDLVMVERIGNLVCPASSTWEKTIRS
jgi:hydrogenase nickel incorporation protein HypB